MTEKMMKRMMTEKAEAQAEAEMENATECSFGDSDDADPENRYHDIGENENGVYVGWRIGIFGPACIVAIFYWTGSIERAYTRKAAKEYCALLNNPPV